MEGERKEEIELGKSRAGERVKSRVKKVDREREFIHVLSYLHYISVLLVVDLYGSQVSGHQFSEEYAIDNTSYLCFHTL